MDSKLSWNDLKAIIEERKLEKLKRSVRNKSITDYFLVFNLSHSPLMYAVFTLRVVGTGTSISSKYIIYQEAF